MSFKCKAQPTADPPQDCGWPGCGCDEEAQRVIAQLHEHGWGTPDEVSHLRSQVSAARELVALIANDPFAVDALIARAKAWHEKDMERAAT